MKKIIQTLWEEIGYKLPKDIEIVKGDWFKVIVENGKTKIIYSHKREILRAGLILKTNGTACDYIIEEKPCFKDVCLMIDCSRNAVRNVETVKKLIRNLALIGYTSLMLYTEDTYEVDGEAVFGYLRGKYTKAELKHLSEYAHELGIELIPCLQTLAHMNQLTRYK